MSPTSANATSRWISMTRRASRSFLICRSDVVLDNFLPRVLDGYGLDYDGLRALKSNIRHGAHAGPGVFGRVARSPRVSPTRWTRRRAWSTDRLSRRRPADDGNDHRPVRSHAFVRGGPCCSSAQAADSCRRPGRDPAVRRRSTADRTSGRRRLPAGISSRGAATTATRQCLRTSTPRSTDSGWRSRVPDDATWAAFAALAETVEWTAIRDTRRPGRALETQRDHRAP